MVVSCLGHQHQRRRATLPENGICVLFLLAPRQIQTVRVVVVADRMYYYPGSGTARAARSVAVGVGTCAVEAACTVHVWAVAGKVIGVTVFSMMIDVK